MNKYISVLISLIALIAILATVAKHCTAKKTYTQADIDAIYLADSLKKQEYIDSLEFIRGQLDLQQAKSESQQDRVTDLEKKIDSIATKHANTLSKLKTNGISAAFDALGDTGFVYAPNEYVSECEGCFNLLGKYKKESKQLIFERDSYDSLMRQQASIQENRINELDWQGKRLSILLSQEKLKSKCDTTRKVKLSLMGMLGNPFLPKGGGFGFIYEDKKFNEYGGHVVFTGSGNIYLLHIAKTITFRKK